MANDLNKALLIGRLTRDPEFKMVSNSSLVNFSIANNRTYVSNGEKKEEVNFFNCVAWGKLADILKTYAKKGTQILVEGRLRQSSWDTPDGKKAQKIEIFVETFQFLGGKPEGVGSTPRPNEPSEPSYINHPEPPPSYNPGVGEIDVEDIF